MKGVIYLLILAFVRQTQAIIGYDCGSPNLNVTALSLIEIEECDIPLTTPVIEKTYIQLLQLSKFDTIKVTQCKILISRTIYYCGMHSHVSTVANAQASYIAETTFNHCIEMHQTGILLWDMHNIIHNLKINSTTSRPLTFAGSITADGKCSGAQYSDNYGTWQNVVVQGTITITLQTYKASINLETNQIHLNSGTICQYTDQKCIDIEGRSTFWESIPRDFCKFNYYDVLYEGYAERITDTVSKKAITVYSLSTDDVTFALTKIGEEVLCGYNLIKTEHPKLLILETKKGDSFARKNNKAIENVDMFAYINSKFIYVEKHIQTQMKYLYRDVLKQRCKLEQEVIKNALSIATHSPDEFAYQFMKGPGYMATIAGEVVYIIKCTPVEVKIRHINECYHQLPVLKGNETYFMAPRTHILLKTGIQTTCNKIIPSMYLLNDAWYRISPTPELGIPPTKIKPMTKPTWQYKNPGSLAMSGIYSNSDLESLREHIMFPAEKYGILNTMARSVKGEPTEQQGISLSYLLDGPSIEKIVKNTWEKIWGTFLIIGNASAGLIGLYFCIRTIKLVIDTIIHGYALHSIYGWSVHLIGALWDSVTHLLLHLGKRTSIEEQPHNQTSGRQESNSNNGNNHLHEENSTRNETSTITLPNINVNSNTNNQAMNIRNEAPTTYPRLY